MSDHLKPCPNGLCGFHSFPVTPGGRCLTCGKTIEELMK